MRGRNDLQLFQAGIPQSLKGVANLASYHHSSLLSLVLVSNYRSQFLLRAIIMFSISKPFNFSGETNEENKIFFRAQEEIMGLV